MDGVNKVVFPPLEGPLRQLSEVLGLYERTIPNVNTAVLEHLTQSCPQRISADAFFQHNLQKATAAGAANHFTGNQVFNAQKYLIDASIGASFINLLAENPMLI